MPTIIRPKRQEVKHSLPVPDSSGENSPPSAYLLGQQDGSVCAAIWDHHRAFRRSVAHAPGDLPRTHRRLPPPPGRPPAPRPALPGAPLRLPDRPCLPLRPQDRPPLGPALPAGRVGGPAGPPPPPPPAPQNGPCHRHDQPDPARLRPDQAPAETLAAPPARHGGPQDHARLPEAPGRHETSRRPPGPAARHPGQAPPRL